MMKTYDQPILMYTTPGNSTIAHLTKAAQLNVVLVFSHQDILAQLQEGGASAFVVDTRMPPGIEIIAQSKAHFRTTLLPIIAITEDGDEAALAATLAAGADDWLSLPSQKSVLPQRIELAIKRQARDLSANPLTHLPGNRTISQVLQERMKTSYAILYCDIDNFKIYNDRYGFYAGDRVLKTTAICLGNTLEAIESSGFLGHIGGDDFILIASPEAAQELAISICEQFDALVPSFYNEADKKLKKIVALSRDGTMQEFPLMALSIAVVSGGLHATTRQLGQLVTRLKRRAKLKAPDEAHSNFVFYQEVPIIS